MESLDMASKGGLAGTSEGVFGPLAILLIGFQEHEYEAFKNILIDMEATMIHLIPCNSQMLKGTLKEAFESAFDNNMPLNMKYEILPIGIKRTIILSGMYASEVSQIVSAYKEAKMARAVFAAAIPNNWDHNLLELVEEVYDDHKFMMQKKLES